MTTKTAILIVEVPSRWLLRDVKENAEIELESMVIKKVFLP